MTRNARRISKTILCFLIMLAIGKANAQTSNPKYNKQLADSLGADEYGMKMYVLVILKTGKVKIENKQQQDSLLRGHLHNISRLAEAGKLVLAGPMKENPKEYEGIFVLNVKTIGEANALLETDPAIQSKVLDTELYEWYGSAALPLFLQYHDNVKKRDF